MQAEVTENWIDADPERQPELEDLPTRLDDMWCRGQSSRGTLFNAVLDHLINPCSSDSTSVWEPPTRPDRSFISRRLPDLLALPADDELGSDCDVDVEFLPEVEVAVPANDVPPYTARAPGWAVRIGVDLCGVLLAKWAARMLQNIRTPPDVANTSWPARWSGSRIACGLAGH